MQAVVCYNIIMVVFVIAMDSEAQPVLSKLTLKKQLTVHARKVYLGKMNGK